MQFYSIKDKSHKVSFKQAIINGLAPEFGLYYPETIPQYGDDFFANMKNMTLPELAQHVLTPYVEEDITPAVLKEICAEVFDFKIPLIEVEPGIYSLELFHGPTLAFKDVGARFLARCMKHLNKEEKIRVLVATSGDTGSAVANGFLGIKGTDVVVLYPKGKVSELQRKQFATLGQNILPIAIDGVFDDCQSLVKQAFGDKKLNKAQNLTSANSINIARWIPQSVYYYWAVSQIKDTSKKITIAVPSGNLGNITSGMLAKASGLKIDQFIVASNANEVVPNYLKTGDYIPTPSKQTIANAMDVGDPNNFPRLLEIYKNNYKDIKAGVSGVIYSDEAIRELMVQCLKETGYLLDPHGATGYGALKATDIEGGTGIFLETAHAGKFVEEVEATLGQKIELPQKLQDFAKRTIKTDELSKDFADFKAYLESH